MATVTKHSLPEAPKEEMRRGANKEDTMAELQKPSYRQDRTATEEQLWNCHQKQLLYKPQ